MATMRVTIDANVCEGHGRCYVLSPEVFAADEEGNGEVRVGEIESDDLIAAAERAAKNCPESAITVSVSVSSTPPEPRHQLDASH